MGLRLKKWGGREKSDKEVRGFLTCQSILTCPILTCQNMGWGKKMRLIEETYNPSLNIT